MPTSPDEAIKIYSIINEYIDPFRCQKNLLIRLDERSWPTERQRFSKGKLRNA